MVNGEIGSTDTFSSNFFVSVLLSCSMVVILGLFLL